MDPLTITLGVASLLGCVAKVIKSCNDLQVRYNLADDLLPCIASECDLMRVGFSEIHQLLMSGHDMYRNKSDLLETLENTLAGCSFVLAILREEVLLSLQSSPFQPPRLNHISKLQFLCNGTKLQELLSQLRGQQGGLTLILNIMQTKSMDKILELVRSNARELALISGRAQSLRSASQYEKSTVEGTGSIFRFSDEREKQMKKFEPDSDKRLTRFDFDEEIVKAFPYKNVPQEAPLQKKTFNKGRTENQPKSSSNAHVKIKGDAALENSSKPTKTKEEILPSTDAFKKPQKSVATKSTPIDTSTAEYSLSSFNFGVSDDVFNTISARNYAHLQALVDSDIDLTLRNPLGHSALSEAAHLGDVDACRILLQGQAGPESQCRSKECRQSLPIHIATALDNVPLAQVLLSHGAKINGLAGGRRSALHWAAEFDSHEVAVLLLDAGIDPASADSQGDTALHVAVTCRSTSFIKAYLAHEKVKVANIFEATNAEDKTPMHLAVESGGVEGFLLLTEFGAKLEVLDKFDATLLHYAARRACHEAVRMLVGRGLEVNARDRRGQTPLHYAAMSEFDARRTIRSLLDLGADLEARRHSHIEVKRSVPDRRINNIDLSQRPQQEARSKKRKRAPKSIEVFNGRTPFLVAALNAPIHIVHTFIEAGARLDVSSACGCGALALSKRNKDVAVFGLLIETLLASVESDNTSMPLKMLNFAVASGDVFNRMYHLGLTGAEKDVPQHGILPGSPSGIILRSSEGSCCYDDKSLEHIKSAIEACDEAGLSIHEDYMGLSAMERTVLCWDEEQMDQDEILDRLLHHDQSVETLDVVERARTRLRVASRNAKGGADPRHFEKYRALGNRRNELIKIFGDELAKQRDSRDPRETWTEIDSVATSRQGSQRSSASRSGRERGWEVANSKKKVDKRALRDLSQDRDPSSDALRITPLPWLMAGRNDTAVELDGMRRKEWKSHFGFDFEGKTALDLLPERAPRKARPKRGKGAVVDNADVRANTLASRMSALTGRVEMLGMRVTTIEAHPNQTGSSVSV